MGTRGEIKAIFSKSSLCPILKFWILKVLCDVYPKIWSPTMGLFFFNTAYRPKCRRTWFFSKDESKCAFFHSFTLVLCFLNVSSFPPACSRDVNNYLYLKIKLYPLHISEKNIKKYKHFRALLFSNGHRQPKHAHKERLQISNWRFAKLKHNSELKLHIG